MIAELTHPALEYVCLNMRERDRVEVLSLQPHDSVFRLAFEASHQIRNNGRGVVAYSPKSGRPCAVAAFTEKWPGCWEIWMFGTDELKDCAVELIRWFRKTAVDILTTCKGHRLQADSRFDHEEAHKMMRAFGAIEEVRLRRYGKDGSDYIRFVWLNGENDQVLRPHFTRAA